METDVDSFPCLQLAQPLRPRTQGTALIQPGTRVLALSRSVSITSLIAMIFLVLKVKQVLKCHAEPQGKDFFALSQSQLS